MQRSPAPSPLLAFAPWVPYAAVLLGLYVLHSAWWALGLYHAGMLAFLLRASGRPALRSLVRGLRFGPGMLTVLAGALAGPSFLLAWPWVASASPPVRDVLASVGLSGAAWLAFLLYYGGIHPGIEEAFWRGLIAPRARRPWITDLQFAGYHAVVLARFLAWPGALTAAVVLTIVAWTWRRVAVANGGLAVPWMSHFAGDASFLIAVEILARRGPG
jgi:Type II CAAX prenyl endopeptidase Rce1-like